MAAHEFSAAAQDPKLSLKEAAECLDSELFVRRWFERAEREGIAFSDEVRRTAALRLPVLAPVSSGRLWNHFALPIAGAALAVLALSTGFLYLKSAPKGPRLYSQITAPAPVVKTAAETEAANQKLSAQIDRLQRELAQTKEQLRTTQASSEQAIAEERKDFLAHRDALREQTQQLEAQLQQGQKELSQLQFLASNAQREAEEQRKQAGDLAASLVATQSELTDVSGKLKDQSAALNRERELLAMGRDVSDLMGARSLHILDVVDTDTRGKTRPAFGRIFFTEGKSLIFYAYDLNEAKMQKANYQYQVWAKKEGPNRPVKKLGIFYSDDKAQNRWVFKCDDAKVVKEIDSVFVTLGRPNSDPALPEGSPLMFAYLHGAPNHP
jgi:hypothetical protein